MNKNKRSPIKRVRRRINPVFLAVIILMSIQVGVLGIIVLSYGEKIGICPIFIAPLIVYFSIRSFKRYEFSSSSLFQFGPGGMNPVSWEEILELKYEPENHYVTLIARGNKKFRIPPSHESDELFWELFKNRPDLFDFPKHLVFHTRVGKIVRVLAILSIYILIFLNIFQVLDLSTLPLQFLLVFLMVAFTPRLVVNSRGVVRVQPIFNYFIPFSRIEDIIIKSTRNHGELTVVYEEKGERKEIVWGLIDGNLAYFRIILAILMEVWKMEKNAEDLTEGKS